MVVWFLGMQGNEQSANGNGNVDLFWCLENLCINPSSTGRGVGNIWVPCHEYPRDMWHIDSCIVGGGDVWGVWSLSCDAAGIVYFVCGLFFCWWLGWPSLFWWWTVLVPSSFYWHLLTVLWRLVWSTVAVYCAVTLSFLCSVVSLCIPNILDGSQKLQVPYGIEYVSFVYY